VADFHTVKTAVAANTNTKVYTGVNASGKIKVAFVPTSTAPTVIQIAPSATELTAGAGYPLFIAEIDAMGEADLELAPRQDLWIRSDQAGAAYVLSA
jgi:hypothetical protein